MARKCRAEDADAFRRLIQLERETAALRKSLGLEHRVVPEVMGASAERAVHALIGNHASDFLSVHAGDGTYLWVSPSCERLFGWKPDELVGHSAYDFIHPDDFTRVSENHVQHVARARTKAIEYRLRTSDESYRWVETHSTNCKDERGMPQIVAFTRDVTARRAQEQQLARLMRAHERGGDGSDGLLCICAWCKAIAGKGDRWLPIEEYLIQLTHLELTHGICRSCVEAFQKESRGPMPADSAAADSEQTESHTSEPDSDSRRRLRQQLGETRPR